jgi:hypothetical protein
VDWYRPKGVADAIVISHLLEGATAPETDTAVKVESAPV